ncbi:MAG: hypothetical protein ACFCU3_05480 [Verrucomicrobiales bacterium]
MPVLTKVFALFFILLCCSLVLADTLSEEEERERALQRLQALKVLPLGEESFGVTIPSYGEEGQPRAQMRAEILLRSKEDLLEITKLNITLKDQDLPNMDLTILVENSDLHLNNGKLLGENGVVIQRSDFTLTGDTLDYDTISHTGVIRGDEIQMIIYRASPIP